MLIQAPISPTLGNCLPLVPVTSSSRPLLTREAGDEPGGAKWGSHRHKGCIEGDVGKEDREATALQCRKGALIIQPAHSALPDSQSGQTDSPPTALMRLDTSHGVHRRHICQDMPVNWQGRHFYLLFNLWNKGHLRAFRHSTPGKSVLIQDCTLRSKLIPVSNTARRVKRWEARESSDGNEGHHRNESNAN